MSSIPYNYGSYIDAKVSMTDTGHVSAGKQIQSPASAGSRGLAKTTQFTNDRTQMQMGNSPIAESMIEIRNILNRIDGVNVPVKEGHYPHIKSFDKLYGINDKQQYKAMADDAQSMDMGEFMDTYSSVIDMAGDFWEDHQKTSESMEGTVNEDPNTLAKELASEIMRWVRRGFDHIPADALKPKAREYLRSVKKPAVKEDNMQDLAIHDIEAQLGKINDEITFLQIDQKDKESALAALGELRSVLDKYQSQQESAVNELADDDKIEFTKVMLDISQIKDRVEALSVDEEAKKSAIQSLTNAEEALVALDESAVREDAGAMDWSTDKVKEFGDDLIKVSKGQLPSDLLNIDDLEDGWADVDQDSRDQKAETIGGQLISVLIGYLQFNAGQKPSAEDVKDAQEVVNDPEFKKAYQSTESTSEDSDELSRLKELSGIREDADESRYYEYTGKAFAIRPSGDSVWADKADIPSVINVDSIMVSHYPDMDDYVELTMEHDGPWEIYTDKAVEAALEKTLGMPAGSIKWSEQGQQEKGRAHFDVASTAIGKVAGSSMFKQVRAEESYEPFPEADEMTFEDDDAFYEAFGELGFPEDENELFDAEYRGRKVPLNKPMRGDVKKFKVYVKDPKSGNVKKVNFGHGGSSARRAGQKTMKIRKSNPKARKSFRARHNCANPGPKTKARYWSCRKW